METDDDRKKRPPTLMNDGPWGKPGRNQDAESGANDDAPSTDEKPRNPWSMPPAGKPGHRKGHMSALDRLGAQFNQLLNGGPGTGFPGQLMQLAAAGILILWIALTSIHNIGPKEIGVVQRFGKYAGKLEPGLGFSFPAPIDSVLRINVATRTTEFPKEAGESLMLTADLQLVTLDYLVDWRVSDPASYLTALKDPESKIRTYADSAMREALASQSLAETRRSKISSVEQQVMERVQATLDGYGAGIRIEAVDIARMRRPIALKAAVEKIATAQKERGSIVKKAKEDAALKVQQAREETKAFDGVFEAYRQQPETTRRRLYYETMEDILSQMDKTIVEPGTPIPPKPAAKAPAPATGSAK